MIEGKFYYLSYRLKDIKFGERNERKYRSIRRSIGCVRR